MRLTLAMVASAIFAGSTCAPAYCEATVLDAELSSPSPQTAWLVLSTPDWRVWGVQTVTDSRKSYPTLRTIYFRQPAAGGKATLVHDVTMGGYPDVLALLSDGTLILEGRNDKDLRWIAPGDHQGGKLVNYDGLGKEWRVAAGYADGLLTEPFENSGGSPPDTFIPIRNGRLMLAEKVALPIEARLVPWKVCPVVRHKNTLAWIEKPDRDATTQTEKPRRLVTFGLDNRERTEVVLGMGSGGPLLMYDGQTAVATNGDFFDAATGKNLLINSDSPLLSNDEVTWYEELRKAVDPPPHVRKGGAITVHNRTLYYISVAEKDEQVSEFKVMAGTLRRPMSKATCLLAFPYYKCSPLYGESQARPEHLLSRQCILMDGGISVWNGTKWVNLPWVADAGCDRSQTDAPADKPRR